MATKYIDRSGNEITKAEWGQRSNDRKYRLVKQFDNGRVDVSLLWRGLVAEPYASSLEEFWPVFIFEVFNYREDGTKALDPIENERFFPNEEEAIKAYEAFLLKWSDSNFHGDEFVEVGNKYTPPPPPKVITKDEPITKSKLLGSEGVW
jgi:hypothetical protein